MSIQSELASMYALMLRRGASEDIARVVATALCRELAPDNDDVAIREGVSRAIAATMSARAPRRDPEHSMKRLGDREEATERGPR